MCSSHKGKKPPSSQDIDLCVLISLGKAIHVQDIFRELEFIYRYSECLVQTCVQFLLQPTGNFCVSIISEFNFKGILSIKKNPGHVCNISDTWLIPPFVKSS